MTTHSNAEIILGTGKRDPDVLRAQGMDATVVKRQEAESAAILENMSPPGAFPWLPPLLEKRRLSMGLVDQLFTVQACYHKLFVWQLDAIDMLDGMAGQGSSIHAPGFTNDREHKETPRAIIIAAGIDALDSLRSHGMDLGHIIIMQREAPHGIRVATIFGEKKVLMILEDGDICGSEDLAFEIAAGRCESFYDTEQNVHKYRDPRTKEAWDPELVHEGREQVEKAVGEKAWEDTKAEIRANAKKAPVKKSTPRVRMGM